jgi:hypothetical protein
MEGSEMRNGKHPVTVEIGLCEEYGKGLRESEREQLADKPVWLVAARGRHRSERILTLIAVKAKDAIEARWWAVHLAQMAGRPVKSADAVYEMSPAALSDRESDFALLYRRAEERGVAAIEIRGTVSPAHVGSAVE